MHSIIMRPSNVVFLQSRMAQKMKKKMREENRGGANGKEYI